jgi:hypothetical protein
VLAEAALRGTHDALALLGAQSHVAGAERHDEVVAQRALAIGDGLVDDVRLIRRSPFTRAASWLSGGSTRSAPS